MPAAHFESISILNSLIPRLMSTTSSVWVLNFAGISFLVGASASWAPTSGLGRSRGVSAEEIAIQYLAGTTPARRGIEKRPFLIEGVRRHGGGADIQVFGACEEKDRTACQKTAVQRYGPGNRLARQIVQVSATPRNGQPQDGPRRISP